MKIWSKCKACHNRGGGDRQNLLKNKGAQDAGRKEIEERAHAQCSIMLSGLLSSLEAK